MKYKINILFTITLLLFKINALKIPSFLQICKRNDPMLNECALESARTAFPNMINGLPKYHIPSLKPLHIPKISIQAGTGLYIELKDVIINGLDTTWISSVNLKVEQKHLEISVKLPKANLMGEYKMKGRILILPIQGDGNANLTFIDSNVLYSMDYILEKRSNKEYISITNHSIFFTTKRGYYYFTNLFNGNEPLGNEMNRFLDDNWLEVTKDLGSTASETISTIITSTVKALFNKIPLDDILPL